MLAPVGRPSATPCVIALLPATAIQEEIERALIPPVFCLQKAKPAIFVRKSNKHGLSSAMEKRTGTFFATPDNFRAWLKANHVMELELWVGFYKRESKRPSITWPESVDEALCFGWIDGLRQNIDAISYRIRFTPRKPTSTWSAINIKRIAELAKEGRLQAAGKKAFAARKDEKSKTYTYENKDVILPAEYEARLRKNKKALKYFDAQAPSYRKGARRWIMSAKQQATRESRLQTLIDSSAAQDFIPPFKWSMRAPGRVASVEGKRKKN
jgi:uncharacterized protein YdeI (YjbR/CyaY-like superfamily)